MNQDQAAMVDQLIRKQQLEEAQDANMWNNKEDVLQMLKHYSENDGIPAELKKSNWALLDNKNLLYSFLNENDIIMIDLIGNINRIDQLMKRPAHKITFQNTHDLDQIQINTYFSAKRAIGTRQQLMNERTLENTQILQRLSASQSDISLPKRGGIKAKLGRAFG